MTGDHGQIKVSRTSSLPIENSTLDSHKTVNAHNVNGRR